MKRNLFIIMLIAVVSLVSCSSSDDSNPVDPIKDLVLTADNTGIVTGETVKFTVTVDGKEIKDADIYVNDAKSGYEHTFRTVGVYRVVAKKANANNSNTVSISVTENVIPEPEPGEKSKFLGKWTPQDITVNFNGVPVPGGDFEYPHQAKCDKDTVELLASYEGIYSLHNESCQVTKQTQTWKENGNAIVIPIMGIEIEADVKVITSNTMIIEIDVYKYKALVDLLMPELSPLIIKGMKANLKLVK